MLCALALAALLSPVCLGCQTPDARTDSIARAVARAEFAWQENVAESARRRVADSVYRAQLEFAVQRSAVDGTWMGVFVGATGVLFTIGAIAAGWLLYRQGRDYQAKLDETLLGANRTIDGYRAILEGFIAEKRAEIDVTISELKTTQAAADQADTEGRKRIEEKVEQLERYQATLTATSPPTITMSSGALATINRAVKKRIDEYLGRVNAGLSLRSITVTSKGEVTLQLGDLHATDSFVFTIPHATMNELLRGGSSENADKLVATMADLAVSAHRRHHPRT